MHCSNSSFTNGVPNHTNGITNDTNGVTNDTNGVTNDTNDVTDNVTNDVPNGVTNGTNGVNVGARMYLLEDEETYKNFKLLNKEFTFGACATARSGGAKARPPAPLLHSPQAVTWPWPAAAAQRSEAHPPSQ